MIESATKLLYLKEVHRRKNKRLVLRGMNIRNLVSWCLHKDNWKAVEMGIEAKESPERDIKTACPSRILLYGLLC